ncbi:MAG: DUF488 family protein [Calditrichaeota bacterium]|nr:MAG: DUF488 family protein [Calditrichota bacterium]
MIKVKSVYERPKPDDGYRILVDLFWPEGVKTRMAQLDDWYKELGPSYDLERFHFNTNHWEEYKQAYLKEVLNSKEKKQLLEKIAEKAKNGQVTLVYGHKDPDHNHAVILKEYIEKNYLTGEG